MKAHITAYPYATQHGDIEIPDGVDMSKYIVEHWDAIDFDKPDLDYCGTDFDIEIEEENAQ